MSGPRNSPNHCHNLCCRTPRWPLVKAIYCKAQATSLVPCRARIVDGLVYDIVTQSGSSSCYQPINVFHIYALSYSTRYEPPEPLYSIDLQLSGCVGLVCTI